jgi:hypothetical protein
MLLGSSGLIVREYSPQRHRGRRGRSIFLIKNSLLRALCASAVQSPSPASQVSLKNLLLKPNTPILQYSNIP